MTVTILSLVCIVLAALCLCLWVYASMANEDLIEAQWEADCFRVLCEDYEARLKEVEGYIN